MSNVWSARNTVSAERLLLSGKRRKLILLAVLSAVAQTRSYGQAYTESVLYSPPSLSAGIVLYSPVIQASDGNFYGIASSTADASGNRTGGPTLYKVSPLGQSAVFYGLPLSLTNVQRSLIQGGDGAFYGVDEGGSGSGLIFKVSLSGTYTVVHAFCSGAGPSSACADGYFPNAALVQGSDGNLYGTTTAGGTNINAGTIFKVTPTGTFTTLYNFCSGGGTGNCTDGLGPSGLVQGTDGYFYGTTIQGGADCPAVSSQTPYRGCGTIFKISSTGVLTTLHTFAGGNDGSFPNSTLVEASDGSFYGVEVYSANHVFNTSGYGYPAAFKMAPNGTVISFYSLQISRNVASDDGQIVASDGSIYGTDPNGGNGNGIVYQIGPTGLTTTIYSFPGGPSGANPEAPLVQGSDGSFYGTTLYGGNALPVNYGAGTQPAGTVYKLSVSPALTPPVSLSLSQQTIQSGQPVTLNWSVANAYSLSLQQCYAFVQGAPSGAGTWTGLQTGTFNASSTPPFKGSASITPTANGVYVYALTCGGKESGFATLLVGAAPTLSITTANLPAGQVGNAYSQTLAATGGVPPYTWSIASGSLPAGIVLSPPTGAITGTPIAPGATAFTLQVKDSETTTQIANANLIILVNPAPLAITRTTLGGATVGTAYSQTLQASGGVTPYSWSIASGSLPPGLSLSSSTGVISGTPTSSATYVFSVKVTDSQGTPQNASAGLNIAVANATLFVSTRTMAAGSFGTSYSAPIQAYGGTAPYTWLISSGNLPAGLMLGQSTGIISGTPSAIGTSSFTVQVKDSQSTPAMASASLSITISAGTLSIFTSSLPGGTIGSYYSQTLQVAGGSGPYTWSVTPGSLPAGLAITASTGVISGNPNAVGTSSFTVQAKDSQSTPQVATANLSITIVAPPLSIATASLFSGTIGNPYSQILQASGGVTPYTWSISSGSLPAGLTLTSSGTISGIPTTAATASFTVQVADSQGTPATSSANLSITINPATLLISTSSLPGGTIGNSYSQTLRVAGGTAPYTWSIVSGSLPAGLALAASTGVVSGTPNAVGTSSFNVQVKDSQGTPATASANLSITINPATLSISTSSLPSGTVGTSYSQSILASGGVAPYTWSVSSGSLPAGLSLAASSGVISGTPNTVGTSSFTVQVKDSQGTPATASANLGITVNPLSLTITTSSLAAGTTGQAYSQSLQANGGLAPYTWSVVSGTLPPGLVLAAGTGTISGTPTTAATFSFTISVKDSQATPAVASAPLAITVSAVAISLSPTLTAITISAPGASASTTVQISSLGGFVGTATVTCAVQYQGSGAAKDLPSCIASPSTQQLTANGSATSTITVGSTAAHASLDLHPGWQHPDTFMAILCFCGLGVLRRKRLRSALLLSVCLAVVGLSVGCGGGTVTQANTADPGTTRGTYNVFVTASSGTVTATTTISLTVQ